MDFSSHRQCAGYQEYSELEVAVAAPYPKLAEVRRRYKRDTAYRCTHCGDQVPANVTHAHVNVLFERIAELETKIDKLETEGHS